LAFPTLDRTFASNIGAGAIQARSGSLTIPANALIGGLRVPSLFCYCFYDAVHL
jgi:hypothetical protein